MRPPQVTRPPGPGGPEYASPTPALRMRIVSAAESSATGTSINPDAVARLPGCPPPRASAWAPSKLRAGGPPESEDGAAPAGGAVAGNRPHLWTGYPTLALGACCRYIGSARRSRLA